MGRGQRGGMMGGRQPYGQGPMGGMGNGQMNGRMGWQVSTDQTTLHLIQP